MKALILAAGDGSRLGNLTKDSPKPLIELLGLSLIERVILTAKQAGISEFVIVVGYLGDKIKARLGNGDIYRVKIEYVENKEWEKSGYGASVLEAKELLSGNFAMLMADHIYDFRILKRLVKEDIKSSVILAVDRKKAIPGDTKVLERKSKIVDIGKDVKESNCIDTGIFLCSPKIFLYMQQIVKEGKKELSDGIAKAAKKKDAEVFDIAKIVTYESGVRKSALWIDVDTEEDLKRAERSLLKSIQKRNHFASYYNAPFEDKVTYFISKYTSITPNKVTVFTNISAYSVALLFLTGHLLLASILTFIVSMLDGVDGKLARLKHLINKSGKLEHSFDLLWETSWIIAFSLALSDTLGNLPLALALIILAFDFFNRHISMQFNLIMGDLRKQSRFDRIFGLIDARRNTYLWYILAGVLIKRPIFSLVAILFHAMLTSAVYATRTLQHTTRADREAGLFKW